MSFRSNAFGSAQLQNSSGSDQLENVPPTHNDDPHQSMRTRQKSSKLKDYICYSVWSSSSIPFPSLPPSSSATPGTSLYPLTHYLNCDRFSHSHWCFSAAISIGFELTILKWYLFLNGIVICNKRLTLLKKMVHGR